MKNIITFYHYDRNIKKTKFKYMHDILTEKKEGSKTKKMVVQLFLFENFYIIMDFATSGQCVIHECCWNPSNSMHFMLGSLLSFSFGLSSIGFALIAHLFIYCFGKVNHILFSSNPSNRSSCYHVLFAFG